MRRNRQLLIVILTLALISAPAWTSECSAKQAQPLAEPVSLVALITEPEKYDGKQILTTGYVSLGFERDMLFISPYDSQEFSSLNGLVLNFSKSEKKSVKEWTALLDHQTVDVQGTFYYPKKHIGEGGYWTGYPNGWITEIEKMRLHDLKPSLPPESR